MAYDNRRNGPIRGGYGGGQRGGPPPLPMGAEPMALREYYVTLGAPAVQQLARNRGGRFTLTTSKIRSILAMVSEVYNEEMASSAPDISADSAAKLRRIHVRLVYEAGREPAVKNLVEKAELLAYLKGIGHSREAFLRYAGYLEALTAYHRFYGGDK